MNLAWAKSLPQEGRDLALALLDLIAPPRCMGCLQEGVWLCNHCKKQELDTSSLFIQHCVVCGQEERRGLTCVSCRDASPLFGLISAGPYQSVALRRGIHWLKFKGVQPVAEQLAHLLIPKLLLISSPATWKQDIIVTPIPLSHRRMRERGFNQSEALARHLSRLTSISMIPLLARTRATHAQAQLPHDLRGKNVDQAFALVNAPPSVKHIVLLDDVATTGSTLSAAASALKSHTTASIWGLTVARG